jgi:hypothetical protein
MSKIQDSVVDQSCLPNTICARTVHNYEFCALFSLADCKRRYPYLKSKRLSCIEETEKKCLSKLLDDYDREDFFGMDVATLINSLQ